MIIKGDDLILDSGLRLYANGGVVGIDTRLGIYSGYKCDLSAYWDGEDVKDLTPEHKAEIARYMIALWEKLL